MTVINIMSPAEWINEVTVWAAPIFDEFKAVIYVAIGLFAAAVILLWFGSTVKGAVAAIFGRKDNTIF